MPTMNSRNGKFVLSVSENAKIAADDVFMPAEEYDHISELVMNTTSTKISLADVCHTLSEDIFENANPEKGLRLLSNKVRVHLFVKNKWYMFIVSWTDSYTDCLKEVAEQIEL